MSATEDFPAEARERYPINQMAEVEAKEIMRRTLGLNNIKEDEFEKLDVSEGNEYGMMVAELEPTNGFGDVILKHLDYEDGDHIENSKHDSFEDRRFRELRRELLPESSVLDILGCRLEADFPVFRAGQNIDADLIYTGVMYGSPAGLEPENPDTEAQEPDDRYLGRFKIYVQKKTSFTALGFTDPDYEAFYQESISRSPDI